MRSQVSGDKIIAAAQDFMNEYESQTRQFSNDEVRKGATAHLKFLLALHQKNPEYKSEYIKELIAKLLWLRADCYGIALQMDNAVDDIDHFRKFINKDILFGFKDELIRFYLQAGKFYFSSMFVNPVNHVASDKEPEFMKAMSCFAKAEELNPVDPQMRVEIRKWMQACQRRLKEENADKKEKDPKVKDDLPPLLTGAAKYGVEKPRARKAPVNPEAPQGVKQEGKVNISSIGSLFQMIEKGKEEQEQKKYVEIGDKDSVTKTHAADSRLHSPNKHHQGNTHHLNQPGGRMGGGKK